MNMDAFGGATPVRRCGRPAELERTLRPSEPDRRAVALNPAKMSHFKNVLTMLI
jgi:hypothetical protein